MDEFRNTKMPKVTDEEYKEYIDSKQQYSKEYHRLKKYMNKKYPGGAKRPRIIIDSHCNTGYRFSWCWEGEEALRQLKLKYRQLEIKEGIEMYHLSNELKDI